MAATRRGLQLGLSLTGGTEVPFPSLDALAEFVRRLFLSGGGRDGAAGIVPPPGSPPPDLDDGDSRPVQEEDTQPSGPHEELLSAFASTLLKTSDRLATNGGIALQLDPLGETSITKEMPAIGIFDRAHSLISAQFIQHYIANKDQDGDATDRLTSAATSYLSIAQALPTDGSFRLLHIIQGVDPNVLVGTEGDTLDALARFPIPLWTRFSYSGTEDWVSLKDLFYGLLANPGLIIQTKHTSDRLALFLFTAAAMIRRNRPRPREVFDAGQREIRAASMLDEVFNWLRPQIASFAYNPGLEELIINMSRMERPEPEPAPRSM
jgi:hypothetical protein